MLNNPNDGHVLAVTLQAVEALTGTPVSDVYADKGHCGNGCQCPARMHIAGIVSKRMKRFCFSLSA